MITAQKDESAKKFQDFVYNYFRQEWKWNLIHNTSYENQYKEGENHQGIEIKHDQKFESGSPNVYISVKRTYPYQDDMPSGIMKEHNRLFYVIGGINKFYIFPLNKLRRYFLDESPRLLKGFTTPKGGTEYGFLLSTKKSEDMAIDIYEKIEQQVLPI